MTSQPGGEAILSRVIGNVFWSAKDPQVPDDWEDGAALDLSSGRFAVADGASAAYRAREWAAWLVESYLAAPPTTKPSAVLEWLAAVANDWKTEDSAGGSDVEWYHQDAARRGSFAAFVGTRFEPSLETSFATPKGELTWSAVAVGDCCLLQVRGDQLMTAFPLSDPTEFGSAPVLVPSAADKLPLLRGRVHTITGNARPGDVILLSSDAFAKFMLTEAAPDLWRVLRSIKDNRQFTELLHYLWTQNALEVDDVTLLRVIIPALS